MVFAPKLSEGVAFNQPVQQPNAMEAIAGLFNFGADTLIKSRSGAPKPTEDEKFAMAVKEFEGEKGATFNWDRKGMREFIFKYPQFTDQAKGYAENLGVMTTSPQEVARDAANDWFSTPEGMLAVAQASNMPEEQQEAFLSEAVTKNKQQEAKLAELERNNAIYAAEGTLVTRQWDAIKPGAKDMVDNTVSAVLNPIISDVMNGLTVDIPPELQAQLGIRYDKVDMNNLNAVLSDTKIFLEGQVRSSFNSNFGQDALPADDWNKQVFASLDGLMKIGESVKDPVARAATQKALIDSEMYKKLDENGVAIVVRLAEVLPPENLSRLIGDMAQFDEAFSNAIAGGGSVFGTAGIKTAVQDGSKTDAESVANDTIKTFEYGIVPEFFTAFKEAQKRSGYNVVDGESYKKIVGNNIKEITSLVAENPDFRMEFGDWITSDVQQTISTVRSNLPSEVSLVVNSKGQFTFVYTGTGTTSRAEAAMGSSAFAAAEIKKAEEALPEDLNLRVLNEKIATLGLMGEFGKEIQGAIGILNTEPKGDKKPVRGGQPPRGRGRGRGTGPVIESGNFVVDGLVARGMPQHIAEGFAMNVKDESNFNPTAVGDNGNAYGLAQWNGPRKRALETYAASIGGDVADPEVQMDFLMHELETNEAGSWAKIQGATTAGEAAALIVNHFERPAESHRARREAAYLGGQSVGPAGAPVDSLPKEAQGATSSIPLGSASPDAQRASGEAPTASTGLSTGGMLSFESPEVQQIVEKATSAPEEAIAMAKEILAKPMDPSIKALIEALVRIGERA